MTNPLLSLAAAASVPSFDWDELNPLTVLGNAAAATVTQGWQSFMTALWTGGLWLMGFAFKIVDAFTTPDLTQAGPMGPIYPATFAIGGALALILGFLQIGTAAWQRDGKGLARLLVGVVQFALAWGGMLGVGAALTTATTGLAQGLLQIGVGSPSFGSVNLLGSWQPRDSVDAAVATVLGVCGLLLILAAVGYLMIMLVRAGALVVLIATSPICAAGLLAESTRAWFWKSLRWFVAALMIAPLSALVLGVGKKLTDGVLAGAGESTEAAVGQAVVGTVLVIISAFCPLILFRLLAFVDPGTSSGASFRASLDAAGGCRRPARGPTPAAVAAARPPARPATAARRARPTPARPPVGGWPPRWGHTEPPPDGCPRPDRPPPRSARTCSAPPGSATRSPTSVCPPTASGPPTGQTSSPPGADQDTDPDDPEPPSSEPGAPPAPPPPPPPPAPVPVGGGAGNDGTPSASGARPGPGGAAGAGGGAGGAGGGGGLVRPPQRLPCNRGDGIEEGERARMTTREYGEYTRDRVGWFFGMTAAQLAVVTGSGLPLLLAVGVQAWALAGVCLLGWAGVLVLVLVPVHGRSATQWLGALAAHTTGRVAGWSAFRGRACTGEPVAADEADLPGILSAVQVHDGPPRGAAADPGRGDPGPRRPNVGGDRQGGAPGPGHRRDARPGSDG